MDQESGEPAAKDQCKKVSAEKSDKRSPEGEGLLVEEEEQENFLELLMRRVSPERSTKSPSAKSGDCSTRDRRRKNKEKKARKKNLKERATGEVMKKEEAGGPASGKERQVASNLAHNPEAKAEGWPRRTGKGRASQRSRQ